MKKKAIQLTEQELRSIIQDSVNAVLLEMEGETFARINKASKKAKDDIQNGNPTSMRVINNKSDGSRRFVGVNNSDTITRATNMQPEVQQHWLKDYIGKTFNFFAEDRLKLVAHLLFTFEEVTKFDIKKTILVGNVVFNNQQISGDGIIIDFTSNKVKYHERGNRYTYNLEIDNRFKPLWDSLLGQIRKALENMR